MKQKEGEEEERRKRRRRRRREEETHPVKSLAKPNPSTAKPNSPLRCHLYVQNQTHLQKNLYFFFFVFSSSSCSLNLKPKSSVLDSRSTCTQNSHQPLAEYKTSVLDSIFLVEAESNKLEMLIC